MLPPHVAASIVEGHPQCCLMFSYHQGEKEETGAFTTDVSWSKYLHFSSAQLAALLRNFDYQA